VKDQELELNGQTIHFRSRQSSRAERPNMKLRNGEIIVTVPEVLGVDPKQILKDNEDWTLKHWEQAKRFRQNVPEREFCEGSEFSVLGDIKQVEIEKRRSNEVDDDVFLAEHLVEKTGVKDQLRKALKSYARQVFEQKASSYSKEVGKDFDRIFVRNQTTRWGSCSSRNNLNFNWRLILGPEHVLEYVVVHELAHLEHPDHSREFWSKVENMFPDYSYSDNWLSENSAKLVFDPEF
jgi:predicted metal-dependent hydrolase